MKLLKNDFCYFSYIEYEKQDFSHRRYVEDRNNNVFKNYIPIPRKTYGFLEKETDCYYKFRITDYKGRNFYKGGKQFVCSKRYIKYNVDIKGIMRKNDTTGKYELVYGEMK